MKRVNRSTEPTVNQLLRMADNLQSLPKFHFASMELECTKYSSSTIETVYKIVLQPGLDGTSCTIHSYLTWQECQDFYFDLMKGE